jgi:hypothetical protein
MASVARAQTPDDTVTDTRRGEFLIAPLPIVNPTLDNGVALVGGYLFRLDPDDRTTAPSVSGAGGFKTSNGSWGAAVLQTLNPARDAIRIRAVAAYIDINPCASITPGGKNRSALYVSVAEAF